MASPRIVCISLVRNEENFIGWALTNAVAFCDELLVLDNRSTDATRAIVDALARRHDNIRVVTVDDANQTHAYVEHLADTATWVFGVDGDEIYDPAALARLRAALLANEFDAYWRIYGHTIHARELDFDGAIVRGYVPPEARSITKLYNFSAITSWHQPNHERLHGKDMVFKPGYHWDHAFNFWQLKSWEASDCRCLHLCFAPRSSADLAGDPRANPVDVKKSVRLVKRLTTPLLRLIQSGYDKKKNYKYRHYALGEIISERLAGFGRPADFAEFAPNSGLVDAMFADQDWLPEAMRE